MPTVRLDWSKPYDQVIGMPGVAFMQAGHFFLPNGKESGVVDDDPSDVVPLGKLLEEAYANGECELESLGWEQLKSLLDSFGEEYTTREAAIAFLKG